MQGSKIFDTTFPRAFRDHSGIPKEIARAQRLDREAEPGQYFWGEGGGYLPKKRRSRA